MTPNEYQKLAERTECDQSKTLFRINYHGDGSGGFPMLGSVKLLHASIGISGEAGEISSAIEKWLWYGQHLDETNLKEEMGDLMWYLAEMCNALGYQLEEIMEANIRKLKKRYPEKYTDERALEKNRDRQAEAEVVAVVSDSAVRVFGKTLKENPCPEIVQNGNGFGELPEEKEE